MCELYHCSELPDSCWGPESKVGLGYAYNALCSSNLNVDELSGKAFNQALHSFFCTDNMCFTLYRGLCLTFLVLKTMVTGSLNDISQSSASLMTCNWCLILQLGVHCCVAKI